MRAPATSLQAALGVLAAGAALAVVAQPLAAQGWEPVVATADPGRLAPATAATAGLTPQRTSRVSPSPAVEAFIAPTHLAQRQPVPPTATAAPTSASPRPAAALPTAVQQYCANIANPAAEARFAWQKQALADIESQLGERITLLEAKAAELQKWMARRDAFVEKARQSLVLIYSRMRPDAAASQLVAMDEETASAVLLKLEPRTASLILNEMEPARAARLTSIIGAAARAAPARTPTTGPSPAEPERKS